MIKIIRYNTLVCMFIFVNIVTLQLTAALLEMSNSGNADVRILCGAIICRLSSEVDRSEEIVQAGAVPSLITLSNWTHFPTRQRCIVSISNLARGRLRARIIADGLRLLFLQSIFLDIE